MRKFLMGAAAVLALAAGSDLVQANPVMLFVPPPDLVISKLTVSPVPNPLGPAQIGKITIDVAARLHAGRP